jgi:hypothetical protein
MTVENIVNEKNLILENDNSKNIKDKYYKIFYNKKWLIIIGFIIIGILFYIYYYDLPLYVPIIGNLFSISNTKNKKKKSSSNNINELDELNNDSESDSDNENDEWDLELEIQNYMNKQHEIIGQMK